jgi:uncharacterized protein YndB with AHSA1/START domain
VTEEAVIEVSLYIAAQPETVFGYFTDPGRYVQWMGTDATLEPVPGGRYRIKMRDGVEAGGEFAEIDPPHRLVFTWGWTHDRAVPPGATRVVVTLHPENAGTRLVLRHYDLPDEEQREHHRKGWDLYLSRLNLRIQGGDPGPDPNA